MLVVLKDDFAAQLINEPPSVVSLYIGSFTASNDSGFVREAELIRLAQTGGSPHPLRTIEQACAAGLLDEREDEETRERGFQIVNYHEHTDHALAEWMVSEQRSYISAMRSVQGSKGAAKRWGKPPSGDGKKNGKPGVASGADESPCPDHGNADADALSFQQTSEVKSPSRGLGSDVVPVGSFPTGTTSELHNATRDAKARAFPSRARGST